MLESNQEEKKCPNLLARFDLKKVGFQLFFFFITLQPRFKDNYFADM